MLPADDAVPTSSRKGQHELNMFVNSGRHAANIAALAYCSYSQRWHARPPGPTNPLRGMQLRAVAKAGRRNPQGAGATACLRA